jgi:hypothetical protein
MDTGLRQFRKISGDSQRISNMFDPKPFRTTDPGQVVKTISFSEKFKKSLVQRSRK